MCSSGQGALPARQALWRRPHRDGRCGTCPVTSSRSSSTSSIASYCVPDIAVRSRGEHRAADSGDAAAPARPPPRGASGRHAAPTSATESGSTSSSSVTTGSRRSSTAAGRRLVPRRRRWRQRRRRTRGRAGRGDRPWCRARGKRSLGRLDPEPYGRPPGSSSESFQAGTGGSFPRATTRTWVWAAGSTKGPIFERISTASHESTASTRPRSRRCAGTASRCAGSDLRRTGASCSSAMPQVSWIRFPATGSTRHSCRPRSRLTRSSPAVPRTTRKPFRRLSTGTPLPRGKPSAWQIAIPASASGLCAPRRLRRGRRSPTRRSRASERVSPHCTGASTSLIEAGADGAGRELGSDPWGLTPGATNYAQSSLFLKSALDGPGPSTLHVFPFTVSVRQYEESVADATVRVGDMPSSIATRASAVMPTYVSFSP